MTLLSRCAGRPAPGWQLVIMRLRIRVSFQVVEIPCPSTGPWMRELHFISALRKAGWSQWTVLKLRKLKQEQQAAEDQAEWAPPSPAAPSPEERRHMITQLPCQASCPDCLGGKGRDGREDAHTRHDCEAGVQKVQWTVGSLGVMVSAHVLQAAELLCKTLGMTGRSFRSIWKTPSVQWLMQCLAHRPVSGKDRTRSNAVSLGLSWLGSPSLAPNLRFDGSKAFGLESWNVMILTCCLRRLAL